MTDWTTIASLATAGGTLVLAFATFAAVRSSNRSARLAEYAMQIGIRPLLLPSRLEDVAHDHVGRRALGPPGGSRRDGRAGRRERVPRDVAPQLGLGDRRDP